jgi:HD superfamily phosphodiesterase
MIKKYNIDESHGISHSMNVLHFAHNIYNSELSKNNYLINHKDIIYTSAILHDLCDKKYINEQDGIIEINNFLTNKLTEIEIDIIIKIISTMSYSKVKQNGYPNLDEYQLAYHIVREADLLAAYDFDRCMIYHLNNINNNIDITFSNALDLFNNRVLKHNEDNLFITNYSKNYSLLLHSQSLSRINNWSQILQKIII